MIEHYSIRLGSPVPGFMERVLSQAAKNPRSFVIDDGPRWKTICFCSTAESAQRWAANAKQGSSLSAAIAYFSLTPEGVSRDPESGNAETFPQLAEMIRWILRTFPDCQVTDQETGEDVTPLVRADPEILFVPDWKRNRE